MSPEAAQAVLGASVQRLGYSRNPWRIVTQDGLEVSRREPFEHPQLGWMMVEVSGYPRKRDAAQALAEYVTKAHRVLKDSAAQG